MYLESKNFIIRKLNLDDRDNVRALEESRPWIKGMIKFTNSLPAGDKFDYFGKLWSEYMKSEYFWCIYRKDGTFCGDVQLDKDSDTEYHFYIQLMDDAPIEGFVKCFWQKKWGILKKYGFESRMKWGLENPRGYIHR